MGINTGGVYEREFEFTRKDFEFIRDMVGERTGIVLSDHKENMVYGRLTRRIRQLRLSSFREYINLLSQDEGDELIEFTNALTTNLTAFFREPHHFEYLAKTVVPLLLSKRNNRRLRIWSAGCSTGEEPYTLAMVLMESIQNIGSWDVKILATDLDSNVVAKGKSGIYSADRITGITKSRQSKWFRHDKASGQVMVNDALKDIITFKQLNLLHQWPMNGPFDIIFCRNVIIYFNKDTQGKLFDRYASILAPDGYLFVGHSETLHKVTDRFRLLGKTIYARVK